MQQGCKYLRTVADLLVRLYIAARCPVNLSKLPQGLLGEMASCWLHAGGEEVGRRHVFNGDNQVRWENHRDAAAPNTEKLKQCALEEAVTPSNPLSTSAGPSTLPAPVPMQPPPLATQAERGRYRSYPFLCMEHSGSIQVHGGLGKHLHN